MKARLENNIVKLYRALPTRYIINGMPHNLKKLPESVHEGEGFYNVVVPTITTYQALEDLIESDFDGSQWIQRVRNFTQEEIDAYDDNLVGFDLQKEIGDGVKAANQLKVYLKRTLTVNQFKNARNLLKPVWSSLKNGDWDIAKDEMEALSVPASMTGIKNKIIAKIDNYLA